MRKTFGGIKHHWRPIYDQRAGGSTTNNSFVTVLDLTAIKKGKIAVICGNNSWIASNMECSVQVDGGATYIFKCRGNKQYIHCEFHFNKSIQVRHKVDSGTVRTDITYWRI